MGIYQITDHGETPITEEERQARFAKVMEEGGVYFDMHPDTGKMKMSFSQEAYDKIAADAAAAGVSFDEFVQMQWAETIAKYKSGMTRQQRRQMERRAKKKAHKDQPR